MTRLDLTQSALSRATATLCAILLIVGTAASPARADEEETRLTQPVLEPIPDEIERDEEAEPRVVEAPEDRAAILGMTVYENDDSRAIVGDVALGSPAAKAGIRKGDEIVSVAGFRGDSYDEWLEGVHRIVRDTPDGEPVEFVIERRGKRLKVPVRTLIASPIAGTAAGGRPVVKQSEVAVISPSQQPAGIGAGLGAGGNDNDIFVNNSNFFGDDALGGRPNERAIAHLYMIPTAQGATQTQDIKPAGTRPLNNPGDSNPNHSGLDIGTAIEASTNDARRSSAGGFGQGRGVAGARIGLAGFRNREQGMMVMVDVGSLPAGNYMVAIADPGIVPGDAGMPKAAPRTGANPGAATGQQPTGQPLGSEAEAGGAPVEENFQPSQRRRPASVGGRQQQRLQEPLRQQLSGSEDQGTGLPAPATSEAAPRSAPDTGEVDLLSPPDTGQIDPTGQVDPAQTQGSGSASPPGIILPIGVLTVDQSGTGRLQQVVEGVQVADVVGQAIVIFTDVGPPKNTIPPGGNVVDTATPQQVAAGIQGAAAGAATPQQPLPVAAGIIRISSTSGNDVQTGTTDPLDVDPGGLGASQLETQ